MATLMLHCGPANAALTRRLLDHCRQAALGEALWLAPDAAALDAIRAELAAGRAGLCLPRLLTFGEFADTLVRRNDPAARFLDEAPRRLLGDRLISELRQAGELSHFEAVLETRGFAEGVFAFLSELKSAEIWPAELARAAYRLGDAGREPDRRIGRRAVRRKDRQLARLYARYQRQLQRHHLFDSEGRQWHARDLLARGCRSPYESIRQVFLDGFIHFTRTQIEILQALARWVDAIHITLPDEPGGDRGELFARSRLTRQRLLSAGFTLADEQPERETSPPALRHIEAQLFRPLRAITPAEDAAGLLLIQAPGQLGEARLVARQIKTLLLEGVAARDIVVALRHLDDYADLLDEVFTEYGIPHTLAGAAPLVRNPAVATLLRARRVAEEDWPFAGVAALLRSSYLRPAWCDEPDLPARAEALLRLLGEPAGRDAYLAGVQAWIDNSPPVLEDEEGYPRRRQLLQELAGRCRPFLVRFFQAWDGQPARAAAADHLAWLRGLMTDLGIDRAGTDADRAALALLFDSWPTPEDDAALDRAAFGRRLALLSQAPLLPRSPGGPGRVRVLAAEQACHVPVKHLFIMGLGEGGFPDWSAPDPMLDEAERRAYQQAGLDLPPLADRRSEEMLLFYRLLTRARQRLVLSYPAVDDQGQDLLPGSFLTAVLDCFAPHAIETIRRRLLIEGYADETPLSPGELRVQWAARGLPPTAGDVLDADLSANLQAAAELADLRLRQPRHSEYDGLLHQPVIQAELAQQFGPERTFSPTALEDYVACPFRFLLKHVLHLAPLEEPRAEIVQTGRGLVVHRALARLHRRLNEAGVRQPHEALTAELEERLAEAVQEQIAVAGSPAARTLWQLEGIRLQRWFRRYPAHWEKFLAPWKERAVAPRPHDFEVPFGRDGAAPLVIDGEGVTVRIGGRIDRVDLAEIEEQIGFWIIDYKTGSAHYYRGQDLDQLQLPIYALAVEEVVLAGKSARPLGLAYWMVTGSGVKMSVPARPAEWLADPAGWPRFRDQLKAWIRTLATHIRRGDFPLQPREEENCTACDFGQVCRISQSRAAVSAKDWSLPLPVIGGDATRGQESGVRSQESGVSTIIGEPGA